MPRSYGEIIQGLLKMHPLKSLSEDDQMIAAGQLLRYAKLLNHRQPTRHDRAPPPRKSLRRRTTPN